MTIKQLLEMPVGKENRTGGFNLTIKTARKVLERDGKYVQGVVLTDDTGDIDGDVLLPRYIPLIRTQPIHIIVCWLQPTSDGKKLYVEQWCPLTITADEWEEMKLSRQVANNLQQHDEDIPSMCRNSQVREFIGGYVSYHGELPEITSERKKLLNEWVEFVLTGK